MKTSAVLAGSKLPGRRVVLALAAVLAAALLLVGARLAFAATSFSDVPDDAWYGASQEACVAYVAAEGIMTGYAGTDLFGPEDTLTRAQAVTAIYRAITEDPDGLTLNAALYSHLTDESGFSDVEGGCYYTAALNWAASEDIAQGHAGFFRPNDPVTREELVTLLARAVDFHYPLGDGAIFTGYTVFQDDDQVSPWARKAYAFMQVYHLLHGVKHYEFNSVGDKIEYSYFYPQDHATRAEAAAFLTRLDKRVISRSGAE